MTMEAFLACIHLLALLTMVVFLSSEASLCRNEWMNAAVVQRLARLDRIYGIAALAVLATGLARLFLGAKGVTWYVGQPLFHLKMTLFVIGMLLSFKPTAVFRRWLRQLRDNGALPAAAEVQSTRKWIMWQAHLIPVIAAVAVFYARGW
ncbi:MAG: DUF2214 family protein [Comamonas sp.]|jgi:putative membrane protein